MSFSTSSREERSWLDRIPYLLFLLSVIYFAFHPFSLLDFPLDDAWIHRVYAQSFASGRGFEYNPGQMEAGSTSPLWSIVSAPVHWLEPFGTNAVVLAVKLIGILCGLAVVQSVMKLGVYLAGGRRTAGLLAASLVALDPRLLFSALSGMETCLLLSLWLWAIYCVLTGRIFLSAILISHTPPTRPEALVILPLYGMAILIQAYRHTIPRNRLIAILILPVPMLAWALFCKLANGHWLPTTFYMKSMPVQLGMEKLQTAFTALSYMGPFPTLIIILMLLMACLFLLNKASRNIPAFLLLVLSPLAYMTGVIVSRDFELWGYYWVRWTDPPTILLTATAAIGISRYFCEDGGTPVKTRALKIAGTVLLLLSLPHFLQSFTNWRSRLISDCRAINLITVQGGKWINQHTPADAVIGVNDAGATRYFGQRRTIDLFGLNCADVAFNGYTPEIMGTIDFLAVTPIWFYGSGLLEGIPVCTNFSIPAEEYTITINKDQAQIMIYRCR